jgi:hypothetical protein
MPTVNGPNPQVDLTVRVFDDFYSFEQQVPSNEFDAVYSYFASVYNTDEAALSFTTTMFRISQESKIPIINLLNSIADGDTVRLTSNICYYLNGLRSPSTLLGVQAVQPPNVWAARNVLP